MGWGDYFYYCYYYYYYYNYYLKNHTKQNHRQKEEEAREHFSGSHGIVGSEKGVGGGHHPLDSQPWDGQTDGRTSGSPALEDSKGRDSERRSLGHTLLLAEDTSPSPRTQPSPGRRRGARCLGGRAGTRAARLLGREGGRHSHATSLHRSASQLRGAANAQPFPASPAPGADSPAPGWRLFGFGSFLCQRVGRAGGTRAGLDGDL